MRLQEKTEISTLALIAFGIAADAKAFDTIEFESGAVLESRLTATYTLSSRLEKQDALLSSNIANANGNDGDNNFNRGSLTSNRLSLLFDATLKKGDTGFVFSASTFYDDVYQHGNDNTNATYPNKFGGAADRFLSETRRHHGGYSRILDSYLYTAFSVGDQGKATVRLGRHVVSWGETLFIGGISAAQGPADGTKAGIPGTEVKDQLLPEDQISALYEVNNRLSLMGHYQVNWQKTIVNAPGSFMSTSDLVGPGAECMVTATGAGSYSCSVPRLGDEEPSKIGQWGIGAKYRLTDETEVGLVFLNYKDRSPNVDINYLSGTPSFRHRYFDHIKMLGGTFSTSFGVATLGAELSYRWDAPALVNTRLGSSEIATATKADVVQANVNTFINLGRTFLAPQANLLAELAYVSVQNPEARRVPGADSDMGGMTPTSDELTFGDKGLAFSSTLSLSYPGIVENWELGIPVSYSRQLSGRTLQGNLGMGEGDHRLSVGATMTYRGNFQVGLTYLGYFGKASLDSVENRLMTDRDQASVVVKYTF